MKQLSICQIVRMKRTLRTKRYELSKIWESLDFTADDLADPANLNSFYQIQIAISALEAFEENALSVKSVLIEKSTPGGTRK